MPIPSPHLELLKNLPHQPGVYLMKDRNGTVIYVGKAIVLADRVKSYFQRSADPSPKTRALVEHIESIDTVVTGTELEALLLENNLIKKYRPKYNIILRDDKNYPMLRLPIDDAYPRLEIVRRIRPLDQRHAVYFGPYIPSNGLYEMLRLLRTIFPLPNCTIKIDGKAERHCIEFEINRCLAPCTGNQSQEAYREMIQGVRTFLEGKDHLLLKQLRKKMTEKAAQHNYEEAGRIRDQIAMIKRALEHQRITATGRERTDQDVIALFRSATGRAVSGPQTDVASGKSVSVEKTASARDLATPLSETTVVIAALFIRNGMVIGKKTFFLGAVNGLTDAEILSTFLSQFYGKDCIIPKKVILPVTLSDQTVLQQWLSDKRGESVQLLSPSRGAGRQLIDLAMDNAKSAFESRSQTVQKGDVVLPELQALLHLSKRPDRIEGYDISNIMGDCAVGSMVVFEGGAPKKDDYRHFTIKTIEGANDFAMMAEMLTRRIAHSRGATPPRGANRPAPLDTDESPPISAIEREKWEAEYAAWPLPDLILIDGGRGQISAVQDVLEKAGLGSINLIGLAKEKNGNPERVYLPADADPVILPLGSPATWLLMQVRDEAHRFAISHHRKIRSKKMLRSPLDAISGIGKNRRLTLLRHFGSLEKIREAPLEEIEKLPRMNKTVAQKLFDTLHQSASGFISS